MKSSPSIWHYVVSIKSTVKISSTFVAFLEIRWTLTSFDKFWQVLTSLDNFGQVYDKFFKRLKIIYLIWFVRDGYDVSASELKFTMFL